MMPRCLWFGLMMLAAWQTCAQKQLVLLDRQSVVLRLVPGDEFVYRLKGSKDVHRSYVNNISDTAVLAHETVVAFRNIDRVYFRQTTFANKIGGALVIGGAGYFLIDQFNTVVVQGNPAEIDKSVATVSASMVAVGLPLWLIRKKSQRLGGRHRLLLAEEGSPFYKAPPQQFFQR